MAETTGIVVATGAVTMINASVFHDEPVDWRVAIATGFAAVAFAGAERVWRPGAVMLAWTALATILLTRTNPRVPGPIESALDWWEGGVKK